jgi:two-component system, chemotaxis family, chemotaxis protein CheY
VILVVDDGAADRKLAGLWLPGHEVVDADSVRAALVILAARMPDLILIDLLMWPRTGMDLLAGIRANPAFAAVPILIWSGCDDPTLHRQARLLGAQACFVKPLQDDGALHAAVTHWLASGVPRG